MAENKDASNLEESKSRRISFGKYKSIIVVAIIILSIVISGTYFYYLNIKERVSQWDNKIYPGIVVEGLDLSNKTKEEATELIKENFNASTSNRIIKVQADDEILEIKYDDLSPEYNVEEAVNGAMEYGKDHNVFVKNFIIKNGAEKNIPMHFKYDDKKLSKYEEDLRNLVNREPKNATIEIDGDNITAVDGVKGRKIKVDNINEAIKDGINGIVKDNMVVELPVEIIKPKISKEDISKINGKIATFTSDYASNSTNNRAKNVEIATNKVNNTLLMPGDVFSYNDIVGERSVEKGFRNAPTFEGSKVVDGIGGGICQVSTALYRAVMKAGIKSIERTNHSMKPSYSPLGLDAVVAWGILDYKFKNTYNSPIFIEGITSKDRKIIFNIYGNKEEVGNKTYDLVAGPVTTIPATVKSIDDPNLEQGKTIIEKKPVNGYRVSSYLVTTENGQEVNRELINTDNYVKSDGITKVGTKPKPVPEEVKPNQSETSEIKTEKPTDEKPIDEKSTDEKPKEEKTVQTPSETSKPPVSLQVPQKEPGEQKNN